MQIKYKGSDKFEIKSKDLDVSLGEKVTINGFTFPGPGEYEKAGVIMSGIADGQTNTIYVMTVEDVKVCYLGRLNHELTEDESKQIGDVDILFLPLGQEGSAPMKIALKLISTIDPKVVIPMLFDGDLAEFKKSEAVAEEELDLLKIRKADLPEEERKIIILKTQS